MLRRLFQSRRTQVVSLVFGICVLLFVAYVFDPHRRLPLGTVLSPKHWLLHWEGRDLYDAQNALLEQGDPNRHEIALTIDDGPDPRYGPAIAAILKQKDVPATFFLVGFRVKQYPEVARLLASDGFEMGNHTYDHQRLSDLKPHEIANEIRLGESHIESVTGQHPLLVRPPGENYNDKVLHVIKALGYVTAGYTVGASDYEPETPQFIAERIIDRTGPGSIILLHQDQASTQEALPIIIDTLRRRGYRFVTLGQMLQHLQQIQASQNR